MAKLTGTGAPSRALQASIGDIYVDETNRKEYKCVFAYRENDGNKFDTQWVELKNGTKSEGKRQIVSNEPANKSVEEPKEEPVNEAPEAEKQGKEPKRKNYTNYSKQSK